MTREAAKILEMVQDGSISPEEGQRLLEALDKRPGRIAFFLSPYSLFGGDRGLVAVAVRFALLVFYFVVLRHVLPADCRSLWFWTTWGCTCFYKVGAF